MAIDLDMIEEFKKEVHIQEEECKKRVTQKHDSKFERRQFQVGVLV